MSSDKRIATAKTRWVQESAERLDEMLAWCESPIEQLFLLALMNHGWEGARMSDYFEIRTAAAHHHPGLDVGHHHFVRSDSGHALLLQSTLKTRGHSGRVDFAFVSLHGAAEGPMRVAVELDGHDFHERTKEQASRDKARDRRFALSKWTVLRYSGSDIYRRADAIAEEVFWELAGQPLESGGEK